MVEEVSPYGTIMIKHGDERRPFTLTPVWRHGGEKRKERWGFSRFWHSGPQQEAHTMGY